MPLARAAGLVAIVLAMACGPRVAPDAPGEGPSPVPPARGGARAPGVALALGEMCPDRAKGSPAISVVLAGRGLSWSADEDDLEGVVARGEVPRWGVLSYEGKRAGVFTVAGAAEAGTAVLVAAGGYAGAEPCASEATRADCSEVLAKGCGVAIAAIGPPGVDEGEAIGVAPGGACEQEGRLVVDIDGDGVREAFPAASFLDAMRAPADEVDGGPAPGASCTARFAQKAVLAGTNPKHWRGLDVLGVLDLDGDGRFEVLLQYRYGEKRTWAVYTASQVATHLELVAEVEPWGT